MAQATVVFGGKTLHAVAAANYVAGEIVVINELICVAVVDVSSGALGAFYYEGTFDITLKATTAVDAGDKVFWDNTNNEASETEADNKLFGLCLIAAASGDATIRCVLTPVTAIVAS